MRVSFSGRQKIRGAGSSVRPAAPRSQRRVVGSLDAVWRRRRSRRCRCAGRRQRLVGQTPQLLVRLVILHVVVHVELLLQLLHEQQQSFQQRQFAVQRPQATGPKDQSRRRQSGKGQTGRRSAFDQTQELAAAAAFLSAAAAAVSFDQAAAATSSGRPQSVCRSTSLS